MLNKPNGLENLGNTCYLNTCIQALVNIPFFRFEREPKKNRKLMKEWESLYKSLNTSKDCVISPKEFVSQIVMIANKQKKYEFTRFDQCDMSEFLLFLLDLLHESGVYEVIMNIKGRPLNTVDVTALECYKTYIKLFENNYSDCIRIFNFMEVTVTKNNNEILSTKYEPNMILTLPVYNGTTLFSTLKQCLLEYCKPEYMKGDNKWYNEKLGLYEEVIRQTMFWNLPPVIIIHLKRFNNFNQKFVHHIDIPVTDLDLSEFICGYKRLSYVYNLHAVILHAGGVRGGHYVCNIYRNGKWWRCNDSSVTKLEDPIITKDAYCLFYTKK